MEKLKRKRGHPFLPEDKRRIIESFRCPPALKIKLNRYCRQNSITTTEAICQALEMFLDAKLVQGEFNL